MTKLTSIAYICLYVSNMTESIQFYKDILNLEPASLDYNSETTFYSFKTGETTLALEPNGIKKDGKKTKAENPVLIQFKIATSDELEAINQHLEQNGVILLDRSKQTNYGLITNFCDPDGNKLELICSV